MFFLGGGRGGGVKAVRAKGLENLKSKVQCCLLGISGFDFSFDGSGLMIQIRFRDLRV